MLRRTAPVESRTGRKRPFLNVDKTLARVGAGRGSHQLNRMNLVPSGTRHMTGRSHVADNSRYNPTPNQHAFPLLNHTDFGNNDHSNDTKYVELGKYMPKRQKGSVPWFRGANTYSPAYAAQGRFEYMRYVMISRAPQDYLEHFRTAVADMRKAATKADALVVMHSLLRLIVDNYNPQHVHYQTAMETLVGMKEVGYARDVWRVMERQMTWPDDKCIAAYLNVCLEAKNKAWAFECWNRYCTEKRFLQAGEADPKPIARVPFSLNRDELIHLPKWKKFFDHDPNNDVADRNRFNTTRSIYKAMARVLLATGEIAAFEKFFSDLEEAMFTTPTPVPEPPEATVVKRPQWQPNWDQDKVTSANPWAADPVTGRNALGVTSNTLNELSERYLSNEQFYLRTVCDLIGDVINNTEIPADKRAAFVTEITERAFQKLGAKMSKLQTDLFFARYAQAQSALRKATGADVHMAVRKLVERKAALDKAAGTQTLHELVYLDILKAHNRQVERECNDAAFNPRDIVASASRVINEMASRSSFEWSADLHYEIVKLLVRTGTMAANEYFVKNVLRKFAWDSRFCEELYLEYKRHDDVEMWAELTKRMLVWTARYNVSVSEKTKRLIEDDYAHIKVQVRTLREVAIFAFKHSEERRLAQDPASLLPNPVMDYVSHALPFPDRDTGTLDEYGMPAQMHAPASIVKGPKLWAPVIDDESVMRQYTAEWKERGATVNTVKLPAPWDAKAKEYNRGKHPSYDQIYAGPFPEIFPARVDFRKPTRWDFKEIDKQSKFSFGNPY